MDKSELLDELRLEVGAVPDYAHTLNEFYNGIVEKLYSRMSERSSVCLYETTSDAFVLKVCVGDGIHKPYVPFGEDNLSLSAIRGDLLFKQNDLVQTLYTPFYWGHHLVGQLVFQIPRDIYVLSEDDFVFAKEISKFIESQYKRYMLKH